jgi:uncharacterized membrane protein
MLSRVWSLQNYINIRQLTITASKVRAIDNMAIKIPRPTKSRKLKNFFDKVVDNILAALFIAGFLSALVLASAGQAIVEYLQKSLPQYADYWWILLWIGVGIMVIFIWIFHSDEKHSEKVNYVTYVNPIIEKVNSEPYNNEQKESIKSILKVLNSKIDSESLTKILNDLREKNKSDFELALPYTKQYIKQYLDSYIKARFYTCKPKMLKP